MELFAELKSAGLAKVVQLLGLFVQDDLKLRQIQAQNAAQAAWFDTEAVTSSAPYAIPVAQDGGQWFSFAFITLAPSSGAGYYRVDGTDPTAAGVGLAVPSGGSIITIAGANNIRNFRLIAATGDTLNIAVQLFK